MRHVGELAGLRQGAAAGSAGADDVREGEAALASRKQAVGAGDSEGDDDGGVGAVLRFRRKKDRKAGGRRRGVQIGGGGGSKKPERLARNPYAREERMGLAAVHEARARR